MFRLPITYSRFNCYIFRDELVSRIIGICSWSNYQYITNFEWYISVLVELTKVEGTEHGAKIAEQVGWGYPEIHIDDQISPDN